ncbi:MAG: HDIG domain-containing metalloprotein, partial [Phycisphaerales bacterium]
VVSQVTRDVNERIAKDGQAAVLETNLRGLHPKVIETMGKLSFRTSYGQNVLRHSIEVAFLCQMIADELGLDGTLARRAGFLHDIGKAMDHEMEGGHPAIGVEFLRRHGERSEEVLNAVGGHHAVHAHRHRRGRHQRRPPRRAPREHGALREAPAAA